MTSFLQGCFTTAILIAFIALCVFAWHTHPAHMSEGEFIQRKLAEYRPKAHPVYVWRTAKAAAIAEALSLTPGDLDTTVDVRRLK